MMTLLWLLACASPVEVVREGDALVAHGERLDVAWRASSAGEISGRALALDDGLTDLGVARVLLYVSDDAFVEGRALEERGTCPAGYWNQHLRVAALVTADPELRAALARARVQEGDRVLLTGSWLELTRSELEGQPFPLRGQHRYFEPERALIGERRYP